jgi:hypothetical protein
LRETGRIEAGDLVLIWETDQNSALDGQPIAESRDIDNFVVRRRAAIGSSMCRTM